MNAVTGNRDPGTKPGPKTGEQKQAFPSRESRSEMPVSGDTVITPLRSILQRKESTLTQRKRYIKKKIKRNTYFGFYLYLIIVLLSLFTVASYTWFTMSRVPQVNNMNVTIVSQQGLELSRTPGADTWYQQLNFLQMVPTVITNNQVLRPATWSDKNGCFYAATYGAIRAIRNSMTDRMNTTSKQLITPEAARAWM